MKPQFQRDRILNEMIEICFEPPHQPERASKLHMTTFLIFRRNPAFRGLQEQRNIANRIRHYVKTCCEAVRKYIRHFSEAFLTSFKSSRTEEIQKFNALVVGHKKIP